MVKDPLLTMTLCASNETKTKGIQAKKDFQIIRKSTLAPGRIMVSNGSLNFGTMKSLELPQVAEKLPVKPLKFTLLDD